MYVIIYFPILDLIGNISDIRIDNIPLNPKLDLIGNISDIRIDNIPLNPKLESIDHIYSMLSYIFQYWN